MWLRRSVFFLKHNSNEAGSWFVLNTFATMHALSTSNHAEALNLDKNYSVRMNIKTLSRTRPCCAPSIVACSMHFARNLPTVIHVFKLAQYPCLLYALCTKPASSYTCIRISNQQPVGRHGSMRSCAFVKQIMATIFMLVT
jgi:hypothetical protein